jgi:hypothetical protein
MSQDILALSYVDSDNNLMISTANLVGNPPVLGSFTIPKPIPEKPTSPEGPYQKSVMGGAFWAIGEGPNFTTLGPLSLVYVSGDGLNKLLVTTSSDGNTWAPSVEIPGKRSPAAPTVAVWGSQLITLACLADNNSDRLLVITSSDGSTWSATQEVGQSSFTVPALALLPGNGGNGPMVLAYRATDSDDLLLTWETATINPWVAPQMIPGARSSKAPALCAYGDILVLAYVSTSDHIAVKTSKNVVELGNTWTEAHDTGIYTQTTPALSALGDGLVMVYVAWDGAQAAYSPLLTTCPDPYGKKWTTPVAIPVGNHPPSLAGSAPALFSY